MDLVRIQQSLRAAGVDGWLFCDFKHRDPLAYRILGLDMSGMTTRRCVENSPTTSPCEP